MRTPIKAPELTEEQERQELAEILKQFSLGTANSDINVVKLNKYLEKYGRA